MGLFPFAARWLLIPVDENGRRERRTMGKGSSLSVIVARNRAPVLAVSKGQTPAALYPQVQSTKRNRRSVADEA